MFGCNMDMLEEQCGKAKDIYIAPQYADLALHELHTLRIWDKPSWLERTHGYLKIAADMGPKSDVTSGYCQNS